MISHNGKIFTNNQGQSIAIKHIQVIGQILESSDPDDKKEGITVYFYVHTKSLSNIRCTYFNKIQAKAERSRLINLMSIL